MKLLTVNTVLDYTGFKKSTLYTWIRENRFPKPITLHGSRSVRWVDTDVQNWINEQISLNKGEI